MQEELKKTVCEANLELQKHKLVIYSWGNVSGIDRPAGLVVIKPSGVPYDELTPDKMVVLDMEGKIIEGTLNPSSDTPTISNYTEISKPSAGYATRTRPVPRCGRRPAKKSRASAQPMPIISTAPSR
jgi:L-ribulose-5-phosphate 4-epimerase